ncbi:c-type cytochrome [Sulfitobacter brevis]|nr:cytochrome c [Sulfitobacter brevis]
MKRLALILASCAILGAAAGWMLTAPAPLEASYGAGLTADPDAGALVFAAGGCASCHTAPTAEPSDGGPPVLSGGLAIVSDFGTFHVPNISPDPDAGIGSWTLAQFARAVTQGVSPEGAHYYPAFPYTAYHHLAPQDLVDLHAFMMTLPASATASVSHDVGFPFNVRRGLGVWKKLYLHEDYVLAGEHTPEVSRGRYLAEALSHCAECHTSRGPLGGLNRSQWLAGAPNPSGKGRIPNITPAALDWSEADLVEYFTSGFTPDYDSAGGEMAEVVRNLVQLPQSDRAAIAAYLKAVPPVPNAPAE